MKINPKAKLWLVILVATILLLVGLTITMDNRRTNLWLSEFPSQTIYQFPPNFLWGAASAAQHVETQQNTDWTAFELDAVENGRSGTGELPGVALSGHIKDIDKYSAVVRTKKTNYDEMFDVDLSLAKAMGHNAYRFSISWARLFPNQDMLSPDPAGVDYYRNILASLKKHKITPIVSLFHFSTPEWFWFEKNGKRGWERDDAIELFSKFVSSVVENYGTEISHWCTLNEPMTYIFNGYMQGIFPPLEQRSINEIGPVVESLLRAHGAAYKIIKSHGELHNTKHSVGIAKHTRAFEPLRNWNLMDRLAAKQVENAFIWDFLDALQTGVLTISNTNYKVEIPEVINTQDYIGINYYGRYFVKTRFSDLANPEILFNDPTNADQMISDLGWSIYPHGFYQVLTDTHQRYDKPIYILESGMADSEMNDLRRQAFLVSHLVELWNAIEFGGADIRGYIHWSLTDNFEWAEGFSARFGLIKIDYENDFRREPRVSAGVYSKIIEENAVSSELFEKYAKKNGSDSVM